MVVLGMIGIAITTYATSASRTASLSGAGQKAYALAEAGANTGASLLAGDAHPETWSASTSWYLSDNDMGTPRVLAARTVGHGISPLVR